MLNLIWRAPLAAALIALGLLSFTATTQAASGTALGVIPAAAAETEVESRTLTVGADVFIGDRIVTGPKGQVQILFSDRTELVVGPNSALLLEDYLLRDDQSVGKFAINALSGTFRFSTGRAAKDLYEIKTPTGTIGVRGTEFDFNSDAEKLRVMLYGGALDLCNTGKSCVTLSDQCDLGLADTSQSILVGNTQDFSRQDREALKGEFPYAVSQGSLIGRFRFNHSRPCLERTSAAAPPVQSLISNPDAGKPEDNCDGCECKDSCD
ncbi:FecR family protein [Devosia sp. CN2-171]|uniref:FecR family protein n=1 Tax=Devosia sp. CN2-171 TaxID=3400909 RepID=UPI003BF83EF2